MPKYIEIDTVERVNSQLDGLSMGDTNLFIRIEPYSLKFTADDKKLLRQLRQHHSPPFGPNNNLIPRVSGSYDTATTPTTATTTSSSIASNQLNQCAPSIHFIGSPPKRVRTRTTSLTSMLHPTPSGTVLVSPPSPSRKVNTQARICGKGAETGAGTGIGVARIESITTPLPTSLSTSPKSFLSTNSHPPSNVGTHVDDMIIDDPMIIDLGPAALALVDVPAPDALLSKSPAGPDGVGHAQDLARKTLMAFIATMNAAYPDYDFSDSPAELFRSVTLNDVRASMHTHMAHGQRDQVENSIWGAVNAAFTNTGDFNSMDESGNASSRPSTANSWDTNTIAKNNNGTSAHPPHPDTQLWSYLSECELYVYSPVSKDDDPLYEEGTIWSHTVLIFHRKLKRLCVLKLRSVTAYTAVDTDDQSSVGITGNHAIGASAVNAPESSLVFAMDE